MASSYNRKKNASNRDRRRIRVQQIIFSIIAIIIILAFIFSMVVNI